MNSGTGYTLAMHVKGRIAELTWLRLEDFEDRGISSIVVASVSATNTLGADNLTEDDIDWVAAAVRDDKRVETHGASAEEAAQNLAEALEDLVGPPRSDRSVEGAEGQVQQITDRFAERGLTLLIDEVEPNVWHANWFPSRQDFGTGRTVSGLSPLRAARTALRTLEA